MSTSILDCPVCQQPFLADDPRYRVAAADLHWACAADYVDDAALDEKSSRA